MSNNAVQIKDLDFSNQVLQSKGLSVVDFWAEWCGPCKVLGPTVDALAKEYEGKVKVYKMDVDSNPQTPTQYRIRGIPTLLFFKDGQLVDQLVGAQPKTAIVEVIQKHL
jgi:thioredoxin 1